MRPSSEVPSAVTEGADFLRGAVAAVVDVRGAVRAEEKVLFLSGKDMIDPNSSIASISITSSESESLNDKYTLTNYIITVSISTCNKYFKTRVHALKSTFVPT